MTVQGWLLIALFTALVVAITKPMGTWLFALYEGRRTPLHIVLGPLERGFYGLAGIDPKADMTWRRYTVHVVLFSVFGTLVLYALQRLQGGLPFNPQGFGAVSEHLSFNTAISFVSNTNWQSYSGESTMSHLTQMTGLAVQNFLSAATGIAVAFAFIRGFVRKEATGLGNFWADLTRITLYLLVPVCIVYALVLVALGVPQTLAGSVTATTLEGVKQVLALGPVASQDEARLMARAAS